MEIYTRKFDLIDECVRKLETIADDNTSIEQYRSSWKDRDSAERNLQKTIEAIIDIGKVMVSERRLREPGNNREVFLILQEHELFPSEFMPLIDRMIGMRNILVHSYDTIDDSVVYNVLKQNIADIKGLTGSMKKAVFSQQ